MILYIFHYISTTYCIFNLIRGVEWRSCAAQCSYEVLQCLWCFVGKTKVNIYFGAINRWAGLDLVGTPGSQGLCGLNRRTALVGLLSDAVVALCLMLFILVMFGQILAELFEK